MTPTRVAGSSRHALESCTLQLQVWKPFQPQNQGPHLETAIRIFTKKPCRSDRSTAPNLCDSLEFSKLSLLDDASLQRHREEGVGWFAKKRRRRGGSRSVSGRSSDRSGTCRRRCCSVGGGAGGASGTYATCSDFPLAAGGTDSSGELFVNGDGNWGSDIGDARISKRETKDAGNGGGIDRDISAAAPFHGGSGVLDLQLNDSGYGSETGYRGDAEFGYGEEIDEEEEDGRLIFWGDRFGVEGARVKKVGESGANPKISQRCRRKKHDPAVSDPMR